MIEGWDWSRKKMIAMGLSRQGMLTDGIGPGRGMIEGWEWSGKGDLGMAWVQGQGMIEVWGVVQERDY